ncbi:unnamed protein product [Linum trigynum]|uniref:Uncharacterized protein n=1 Tax=Linum trigynum TaxID=586398 RepID=A0AAV2F8A9_9ROSI
MTQQTKDTQKGKERVKTVLQKTPIKGKLKQGNDTSKENQKASLDVPTKPAFSAKAKMNQALVLAISTLLHKQGAGDKAKKGAAATPPKKEKRLTPTPTGKGEYKQKKPPDESIKCSRLKQSTPKIQERLTQGSANESSRRRFPSQEDFFWPRQCDP